MLTRYGVWLNNKGLADFDDSIYIVDIVQPDIDQQVIKAESSLGDGTRYIATRRFSLPVEIHFLVRERNIARRAEIIDRIRGWAAQPGYLTTTEQPGKRLYVVCSRFPVGSAKRWTDELTMAMTAYDVPYWEAEMPLSCTVHCVPYNPEANFTHQGTARLYQRGTAPAPMDAVITANEAVNTIRLVGGEAYKYLQFDDLGMKAGDVLTISHDERGILYARMNGESVLHKRTTASQDDLLVKPGENTITLRSNATCTGVCEVRGRWL